MTRALLAAASEARRALLSQTLGLGTDAVVVAATTDGRNAVDLAIRLQPDIVVMDLDLPAIDGFEATRRIMEVAACPIVLVSATAEHPRSPHAFQALEAGALALVELSASIGEAGLAAQQAALVEAVSLMAQVRVVTRRPPRAAPPPSRQDRHRVDLIGIAASTGGPEALATILAALPADTPAPILIVQHIGPGFEHSLAEWLGGLSPLDVHVARHGESARPGQALVAPGGHHLGLAAHRVVTLDGAPPIAGHRPSATFLFHSIASTHGPRGLGVVLTGMGRDGTDGLLALKRAGGVVVAQDEATSVVYGMPAAAAAAGVVDRIAPLDAIAGVVLGLLSPGT